MIAAAFAATAGAVTPTTVYNNIPSPQPGNVPSVGAEAYAFSEFGGQIQLAGAARQNPTVTVLMSSWGCVAGHWFSGDCATTTGATFSEPITLNLYNVGSSGAVGSLIATTNQTLNFPYRPSADNAHCTGADAGKWYDAGSATCFNGFATPISFNLTGVTLPTNVIVSLSYSTSHYGPSPIGESAACYTSAGGCGYDSLNIGLTAPPSVGIDPLPNDTYANYTYGSSYCAGGAGGTFRLDAGCWTGYQPAISVQASSINTPPNANACKNNGWQTYTRADGSTFKNQGDCIQYVNTGK
jgi:hypothetical protein